MVYIAGFNLIYSQCIDQTHVSHITKYETLIKTSVPVTFIGLNEWKSLTSCLINKCCVLSFLPLKYSLHHFSNFGTNSLKTLAKIMS